MWSHCSQKKRQNTILFENDGRSSAVDKIWGGCGTVGKVVAINTRGPGFKSSRRQFLLNIHLLFAAIKRQELKGRK